jgi:hypothetical protein
MLLNMIRMPQNSRPKKMKEEKGTKRSGTVKIGNDFPAEISRGPSQGYLQVTERSPESALHHQIVAMTLLIDL